MLWVWALADSSSAWVSELPALPVTTSPLPSGEVLVRESTGAVLRLDELTGVERTRVTVAEGFAIDAAGDLVTQGNLTLTKRSGATGAVLWSMPVPFDGSMSFDDRGDVWLRRALPRVTVEIARFSASSGELRSTRLVRSGGVSLVPWGSGDFVLFNGAALSRYAPDGALRWIHTLAAPISSTHRIGEDLLMVSASGPTSAVMRSIEQFGGDVRFWTVAAGTDPYAHDAAGNVFVHYPAERRRTRIAKLDALSGAEAWSIETHWQPRAMAAGPDGDLLLAGTTRCGETGVARFRGEDGARVWTRLVDDGTIGSPLVRSLHSDRGGNPILTGRLLGDRAVVIKLAAATGELFVPDPLMPEQPRECVEVVEETRAELEQCLLDPPVLDADGDGEPDVSDACPATPAGAAIDQAGCSLGEFCEAVELVGQHRFPLCLNADWQNDEPLTFPRDCRLARVDSGPNGVRCTARP